MPDLSEVRKPNAPPPDPAEQELRQRATRYIDQQWRDLKSAYWMYHAWIWESLLLYAGQHWIEYSQTQHTYLIARPTNGDTPQPRINRFAAAIDAVASIFQQIPEIEAVPTPLDDIRCMAIAEIANACGKEFVKSCALRSDFKGDEDKTGIAGAWQVLAGCFFTNVYAEPEQVGEKPVMGMQPSYSAQCLNCDTFEPNLPEPPQQCPNCGDPNVQVQEGQTQQPVIDDEGQPLLEPIIKYKICCLVESPLAAYPRAGAKNMKDADFFALAERWTLDRIHREIGIEASADSEYPDGFNTANENALNFFYLGYSNSTLAGKDSALVIRFWCPPGRIKDIPEGFYAVFVNGKVQHIEPMEEYPLTKSDFKALPTLFFPRSVAFDLAGIASSQKIMKSIIELHAKTTAADPWVVEDKSLVGEITGRGDRIIWWKRLSANAEAPHHAQHGVLDPGVYEYDNKLDREYDTISQAVSVFRGEQPGSIKAGVALETLRSQAEAMFAGPVNNWNGTWKESVRKGVTLMQKHYTMEQLVEICGNEKISEIQIFKQADLDKSLEWVATKQGLPRTRDERRQEMITLFDKGMLDPNDIGVREKAFELFGETGLFKTFNADATRARMENSLIKQGQPPIFMPEIDDNAVHVAEHESIVKSSDFLRWPPELQQAMIGHVLETKNAMRMQQAAEQAAQAPPDKGRQNEGNGNETNPNVS